MRDRKWISTETGVVCMLLVCPECPRREVVARQLLDRCEQFLMERGARPFKGERHRLWLRSMRGLYGGSMPPGIFTSDSFTQEAYTAAGYGWRVALRSVGGAWTVFVRPSIAN